MKGKVTPASAIRANSINFLQVLSPPLAPHFSCQSSCRAYCNTLTTELAVKVFFIRRGNFRSKPSVDEINSANAFNFITNSHTLTTEDTLLHISFHERIVISLVVYSSLAYKPVFLDPVKIGKFLEHAITCPFAHHAVIRVIGEDEFKGCFPHLFQVGACCYDLHPLIYRRCTGCNRPCQAFNFYNTKPAPSIGGKCRMVTESRYRDVEFPYGIKNCGTLPDRDLLSIYCYRYHIPPYDFIIDLNLHTSKHVPHFTQIIGSILCGIFLVPLIASAGHTLLHAPHPVHISSRME